MDSVMRPNKHAFKSFYIEYAWKFIFDTKKVRYNVYWERSLTLIWHDLLHIIAWSLPLCTVRSNSSGTGT